jgi:hypothetical protein
MHQVGKYRPEHVTYGVTGLKKFFVINTNITEVSDMYEWDSIITSPGDMVYGEIVSGFIRLKYSDDEMIAIINNYLNDMSDEERAAEFREMQAWRSESKENAKEAIRWAYENGVYTDPTADNYWILGIEDENGESEDNGTIAEE